MNPQDNATYVPSSKPWWPGDERVEEFMLPVAAVLQKYLPYPSKEYAHCYNRAYEAVCAAIFHYTHLAADTASPIGEIPLG